MKFKIDSKSVKDERKKQWHNWFAWYPVRINESETVWLEDIQRKGFLADSTKDSPYWKWFYKPYEKLPVLCNGNCDQGRNCTCLLRKS